MRGDPVGVIVDHGKSAVFLIPKTELPGLRAILQVRRAFAAKKGATGSDAITMSATPDFGQARCIPANSRYWGFRRTWSGKTEPESLFLCQSTVASDLCVEIWDVGADSALVVVYSDWN